MSARKKTRRPHASDLRGAARVVIDAAKGVTEVTEKMHVTVASGPSLLGQPLAGPARVITGLVYGSIRGVTHVVGAGIDVVLGQLEPFLGGSAPGFERAALLAVLNGVIGDYLSETGNPLATESGFCQGGELLELEPAAIRVAFPHPTGKVLVLAHGSSMNERQWLRGGHDHGAALAGELGYTPVYFRYNSGLHVSANGRTLADLLERLVSVWPLAVTEIAILGHSMGGLVARSACHVSEEAGQAWRAKLTHLITLGTPHHGAPLERMGNWFEMLLGVSRYSAPLTRLAKLRSAGVTDLRYGNVIDAHWAGHDRFALARDSRRAVALPAGVRCAAIAGSLSSKPGKKLRGDGLVPVESALGRHERADLALGFAEDQQWVALGVSHLDLLSDRRVYETIRAWLRG